MSNSALVSYTKISPNSNNPRNNSIKKITIHHMAGNLTLEQFGSLVANPSRKMSSNYAVGTDGRIGLYVDEKNRSWCSSSPANDHQAITIEVANNGGAPNWTISDKAYAALVDLCTDICQRNGIAKLTFTGNANGNLTQHNYFSNTSCPGPYLKGKFSAIANEVNKRLGAQPTPPTSQPNKFKVGDKVIFTTCYKNSTDGSDKALHVAKKQITVDRGIVGSVLAGARNPYKIVSARDGKTPICWCNDGDIRGKF